MKKLLCSLVLVFTASTAQAVETPMSFADLVERLSPAVVNISTTQIVKPGEGQGLMVPGSPYEQPNITPDQQQDLKKQQTAPRKATSLGSGFIIDPTGIVITNNHVIGSGTDITVTLHDDSKYKAKIIGRDTKVDIAVLKITAPKSFPYVKFGNSDIMRVGDWVLAIGNPYGLGGSVTAGIISAKARDINVGPFDDFLQTDAAINRGNSGGPMFNVSGDVIGINTAIFSPTGGGNVGIGFATPSSLVKPVIEQIIKYGRAKRAWLGVKIQTVTEDIAASLGLKATGGALVLESIAGSPSAKAGIKEGDVITKFNGQQVAAMRKLPRIVADTELNKDVPVEVYRNGKAVTVTVKLTEMTPEQEKAEGATPATIQKKMTGVTGKLVLGMNLVEITPAIKTKFKLSQDKGLFIAEVSPTSNAFENGIRSGAVITKAGQRDVVSFNDLLEAIALAKKQNRTAVLLLVENPTSTESGFVPIEIK